MRLLLRWIATMAIASVIIAPLYANDAAKNAAAPATTPVVRSSARRPSRQQSSTQPAVSHTTPKVELFVGYSYWDAVPAPLSNRMRYLHGGSTSLAYNFNRYIGLVADFGGYADSKLTLFSNFRHTSMGVDSSGSAFTYAVGPRLSYRRYERFTPFAEVLAGAVHASPVKIKGCASNCTPLGSDNTFAALLGVGFDIKITRHLAWRLIEGDFLLTHFDDPLSPGGRWRDWQSNVRLSSGLVFRFAGESAPTPAPVASVTTACSADKDMVYAGGGDFVVVRAQASNPGQDSLNYSWLASAGSVDGTGPEARWNSAGREPGAYTVNVRVVSSRNGTADCSVNIRVEARPNRPPTMSCSASRGTVIVGEPVEIVAIASDPDGDPLSFSWTASGAKIGGSASSVTFQTAGLAPGSYTIAGHVDDGRTGVADCSANVAVNAAPVADRVKELETRLALHSIYFQTGQPGVTTPEGGVLKSQQDVLLTLAEDFKQYLVLMPQAHLTLEGHADRRGSIEYNKRLTDRRVDGAKGFLIEHGVPAANIETQSLGKQENLDADQVKLLVDQNPDLSNDERQQIEGNLLVVVMANNRRVDVSLSTTGQQSVRRFPFNAKDSLSLLSTQGSK